jgi:hypothetical protein
MYWLQNLYSSPNIIRMTKSRSIRWVEHVVQYGEKRNSYRFWVVEPEEKRPLRRPRGKCKDNIKTDIREIR